VRGNDNASEGSVPILENYGEYYGSMSVHCLPTKARSVRPQGYGRFPRTGAAWIIGNSEQHLYLLPDLHPCHKILLQKP
jgi:hypothetical protein